MASANLSFTKDGLIYRPQHLLDDEDDDFLTGTSQKDAGTDQCFCRHASLNVTRWAAIIAVSSSFQSTI